jgi:hypothetical protein
MFEKATSLVLLAIMLGSLAGCSNQVQRSGECKAFLKGLKADWSCNSETKIYQIESKDGRSNKDFLPRFLFDNRDCMLGLSQKRVRRLFGEPSRLEGNRWWYYLWVSCHEKDGDCDYFLLEVDENKGLQDIAYKHFEVVE